MIKKLENAGLGFYVRETETHQKLGKMCNNYRIKSYNFMHKFYLWELCELSASHINFYHTMQHKAYNTK